MRFYIYLNLSTSPLPPWGSSPAPWAGAPSPWNRWTHSHPEQNTFVVRIFNLIQFSEIRHERQIHNIYQLLQPVTCWSNDRHGISREFGNIARGRILKDCGRICWIPQKYAVELNSLRVFQNSLIISINKAIFPWFEDFILLIVARNGKKSQIFCGSR